MGHSFAAYFEINRSGIYQTKKGPNSNDRNPFQNRVALQKAVVRFVDVNRRFEVMHQRIGRLRKLLANNILRQSCKETTKEPLVRHRAKELLLLEVQVSVP